MKNTLLLIITLSSALMLQGCWGTYDYQSITNLSSIKSQASNDGLPFYVAGSDLQYALPSQKKDFIIEGHCGSADGVSAAYAISDRIGVSVKYAGIYSTGGSENRPVNVEYIESNDPNTVHTTNSSVRIETEMESNMLEVSGLFFNGGKKIWRSELRGGMGFGSVTNTSNLTLQFNSIGLGNIEETRKYQQLFAQGSFGLVTKRVELVATSRLSSYQFTNREFESPTVMDTISFSKGATAFEYGFRFGLALGKCRFFYQYSTGLPLKDTELKMRFSQNEFGLMFRIGDKIYKKPAVVE